MLDLEVMSPPVGDKTYWIVELADGTKCYEQGQTSWFDVQTLNQPIRRIWIKFRSHQELAIDNPSLSPVYFSYCCTKDLTSQKSFTSYVFGKQREESEEFIISKWKVPEIILLETSIRQLDKIKKTAIIGDVNGRNAKSRSISN